MGYVKIPEQPVLDLCKKIREASCALVGLGGLPITTVFIATTDDFRAMADACDASISCRDGIMSFYKCGITFVRAPEPLYKTRSVSRG